jgi:hypothetical protein
MGYELRMSGEIHDWLTELRGSDPAAARLVGAALTALLREGADLGPPVVFPVTFPWREDLLEALDLSYQQRLERLQITRRSTMSAATAVKRMELQLAELESAAGPGRWGSSGPGSGFPRRRSPGG